MLWGELIGDAVGMPTMWFYSPPKDVIGAFGRGGVTGFAPPPELHPTNTLMAEFYANNREHVREVVGSVILHGKQELWQKKNVHYHAGLRAGENTLNAQLLRVLLRASSGGGGYSPRGWLEAYAKFMTTEGSHNDSYADTAHVQFFYRFSQGTPLEECGGDENHSTGIPTPLAPLFSWPLFARFAPSFRRSFAVAGFLAPRRREWAKNGVKWAKFGGETAEKQR